jgi:glycosyltransferase involved in cell wall biosynthesis
MAEVKPIRVTYLIDSLGMGGAERVLLSTLQHLDRERFEPRVCALQERDGNPLTAAVRDLGITVDMVPVGRLRDPRALARVVRYLRSSRAELLHTQLEFSNILGGVAAKIRRIPCVSTLHTFDDPPAGTRDAWRTRLMWGSMRRLHSRVIAVSEAVRLHHMEHGGLPAGKIVTIYNGVDLSAFEPEATSIRESLRGDLGIGPDAPVMVSVAVLREAKGMQHLLDAMNKIRQTVPSVRLVIVGEGEHGMALRQHSERLGLGEHVVFTGMRSDVADLLTMSDLFVLPTLGDVLPTVVAEAMAAGLPVVATNVGGLPEMVEDGSTGLLVSPASAAELANACARLLDDPDLASGMGRAGRVLATERFDVRGQLARLSELYESLV